LLISMTHSLAVFLCHVSLIFSFLLTLGPEKKLTWNYMWRSGGGEMSQHVPVCYHRSELSFEDQDPWVIPSPLHHSQFISFNNCTPANKCDTFQ
jgi:hypothetical protein